MTDYQYTSMNPDTSTSTQEEKFKDIANAIREKDGSTDFIPANDFAGRIRNISPGIDTSDATATAEYILSGKTAYVNGDKITGTIEKKSPFDITVSASSVLVPKGYYNSATSKSVDIATQATPSITVDSSGLITASATQTAGYVSAGTKSATQQLSTVAATTITPGTSNKTAVASGKYTTGAVTVAGDINLRSDNIKDGVSIFGVTGILPQPSYVQKSTISNITRSSDRVLIDSSNIIPPDSILIAVGIQINRAVPDMFSQSHYIIMSYMYVRLPILFNAFRYFECIGAGCRNPTVLTGTEPVFLNVSTNGNNFVYTLDENEPFIWSDSHSYDLHVMYVDSDVQSIALE